MTELPVASVRGLVEAHIQGPDLGFFGASTVNVLELNLALDAEFPLRLSGVAASRDASND